jgi:hypothetical protein
MIAKRLLKDFEESFVILYGKKYQTYTLHLVCNHLADDAKVHGSLAHHSMFSIESAMGYFRRQIKGNRGESEQFMRGNFNC